MMMKRALSSLFVMLGLTGCATSAPMSYLVLEPVSGPVYALPGQPLAVGQVLMPPAIDRSALTTASSETVLKISYDAQWAAPLGPMAQTVLARDLAARLPGHEVLMPGDVVPEKAMMLSVTIVTFLPYPDHVVLLADWRVAGGTMQAETGRARIVTPASATAQGQAQAMSQALGRLADLIARRITG